MPTDHTENRLVLGIAVVGLTAIVTQTIVLREFLSVFYGNELVIGIVLAVWMILTGLGSLLGKLAARAADKIWVGMIFLLLTSLLPLITVFLLEYLRNVVFPVGTLIGVAESLSYSFILLMPYCLLSGSLFTLLATVLSEKSCSNRIPDVYSVEAIGSVIGGLIFNLILVFVFSTFQTLCLLALLDLGVCLYLSPQFATRKYQIAVVSLGTILMLFTARVNLDSVAKRHLYPGQELLLCRDTPYGNLVITKAGNQKNFFENGSLLFVTGDAVANEDATHYAMIQHPHPKNVLMISGGISGATDEILKYGIEKVDYVELNPAIIEIGKYYTSALKDLRIHAISEDGRRFVRRSKDSYDVVLINVPDPVTAQINRYYTVEFLRQLKERMTPGAVLGMSLLESVDYQNSEARQVSSVIYNTLMSQFKHVLIIPGLRNHYLASDGELTTEVAEAIANRNITTISVNKYYVDDQLLRQRSDVLLQSIDRNTILNSDFTPVAYFRQLQYWLSYFGLKPWIPAVLVGILILVIVGRLNVVSLGMFTGGFAASSIELILLISFQIIYGYVYQATGVVITIFMAGLAAGSYIGHKKIKSVDYSRYAGIQFALALYSLFLPFILYLVKDSVDNDAIIYGIFSLLTVLVAFLIGIEFSFAAQLLKTTISSAASILYSVDLIGSAIGALMISIYVLPLLGITLSCFIVASLCLASALTSFVAGRRRLISLEGGNVYV
jgi:spermidine synthase